MNSKVKVVYLIDSWFPFVGGAQIHLREIQKQLESNKRISSSIYAPNHLNIFYRLFWSVWIVPLILWKNPSFDLIHSHGFHSGLSGKLLSVLSKKPVIHTVHGSHLLDKKQISLKALMEKFFLVNLRYDAIITVSRKFKEHQPKTKKLFVVANGVTIEEFTKEKVEKNGQPTLIFVGRNHPDKGIDVLEKVFNQLISKYPQVRLTKIIDGNYSHKKLIKKYKQSHIFVLPSRAEGQPITLLEAWASKLPVVVSDVGENPFMVKNGVNGYVVENGNVEALVESISSLLDNPSQATRMGKNGFDLVKEKYTWKSIADTTFNLYQKVVKYD